MKNTLIIAGILTVSLTSCIKSLQCIDGNGSVDVQVRETQLFHSVENTTMVDVVYKKGDTAGISIRAETNLFSHIITETFNGKLEIKTDPRNSCFDYTQTPVVTITSPDLDNIVLTGSGDFTADIVAGNSVDIKLTGSGDILAGIISCNDLSIIITGSGNIDIDEAACQEADLTLTGSGDLTLNGSSDEGIFRITGSGDINSGDFVMMSATETISGSGDIYTNVENTLNATISGSGNIYLRGDPVVTQSISGSGRIIKY
jgi:Putative auto-transporter adhesin, head GIN domain